MKPRNRSSRTTLRRLGWAWLVFVLFSTQAFGQTTRETDVEAAYLFNFGKFVHVPPHSASEFRIGILGQDPFSGTLQKLAANETVDGRKLVVVLLSSPDQARTCDIVFLGESETSNLQHDLALRNGSSILTVSRIPGFLAHGGMIEFVIQQDRVRFAVNLSAAGQAHVQLSSELLRVAVHVTGDQDSRGPAA